jgi:hypothetical protein
MKHLLTLILTFSILSNCNLKKYDKKEVKIQSKTDLKKRLELNPNSVLKIAQPEYKKDAIYNYWALVMDTISDKKEFEVSDIKYTLELKTYSLNDSLIVRNLSQARDLPYLDHSHTMVTDFKLLTDSFVNQKRVDRTDFKNSLIPEFYAECNLFSTEIDSIVKNTVYLASDLAIPDTDNQWRVWYSIEIINNRLGKLKISETDYVGL